MAEIRILGNYLSVEVPVSMSCQGNQFIAYSHALDLVTCGDTREQAQQNFHEAVQIFIEDLIEQDVLDDVLEELGWAKEDEHWTPPAWECNAINQSIAVPLV